MFSELEIPLQVLGTGQLLQIYECHPEIWHSIQDLLYLILVSMVEDQSCEFQFLQIILHGCFFLMAFVPVMSVSCAIDRDLSCVYGVCSRVDNRGCSVKQRATTR